MSPARKKPPDDDEPPKVHLAEEAPEEPSDSDDDLNLAEGRLWRIIDFKLRGDWIDRHGMLLIKTFGVIVVTGFMAFVAVRIWGH